VALKALTQMVRCSAELQHASVAFGSASLHIQLPDVITPGAFRDSLATHLSFSAKMGTARD
jgi:hypothetical protein